jgi:large subunit ribosomal protein L25
MDTIALQGHKKEGSGKESAKRIRREGFVPAVLYKSGGGEAISFSLEPKEFRNLVYTSNFNLVEIALDGTKHKCILKDIQFHPVTDAVVHLDFLELVPGVKFKAEVPLRFAGVAPGVKEGGKFLAKLRTVRIITTPEKAVGEMTADISAMALGSTIRVRDILAVPGIDILNNAAVPVASIEIPRALRTATK